MDASPSLEHLFREHRRYLWGLSYRLTGDPAEAEDIVQEAFLRAMKQPGETASRPWLSRVVVNLGRDRLRWRRRRGYVGAWLPGPVPTGGGAELVADGEPGPETRYARTESLSAAFLLALEALTPTQRAALILRDVLGHSAREAADVLGTSEANVRALHARARRALEAYDASRRSPHAPEREATEAILARFLQCLAVGDVEGLEALLAEDVVAISDSGGAYAAARQPVAGRASVKRLLLGLASKAAAPTSLRLAELNGLPAVVLTYGDPPHGWAPRVVMQVLLDAEARVGRIHTILAPRKLVALGDAPGPGA